MDHAVSQALSLILQDLAVTPTCFPFAYDDVDVMLFKPLQPLRELRRPQVTQLAIDACAAISQPSRAGYHFFVKTFSPPHDGAKNQHFFAAVGAGHPIKDLAAAQRADLPPTLDAVLLADLRVKQTQIVIDLGDRRDGRILSTLAEPLLDGDGGRNAGEQIDVRLRHDLKKLARVSGKAVDVTALAFPVDDVEGQRGLSRPAQTGDDHEAISGDVEADIFKVVLFGADYGNGVLIFSCALQLLYPGTLPKQRHERGCGCCFQIGPKINAGVRVFDA